jgi:hypothetical protein
MWKIHWKSTFVSDPFNSYYWKGHILDDAFAFTRLGQERWKVKIDDWIRKSMERSSVLWMEPWRSSKLKSKLMLWRRLYVISVLTVQSYVAPSSPIATTSMKFSIFGFSPKGPTNCYFDFLTIFTLWLYLTPLKLKSIEVAFSKLVSPNFFLSSCFDFMLVS